MKRWMVAMGDFHAPIGLVLEVIWDETKLHTHVRYARTPPGHLSVDGKGFTGLRLVGQWLYVCGFNAIYRVRLGAENLRLWLTRPDFNDLHDVDVRLDNEGSVYAFIANTGLDAIDTVGPDGELLNRLTLRPAKGALITRADSAYFDGSDQSVPLHLRRVASRVHPNTVRWIDDRLWYSRFADRTIVTVNGEHEHRTSTDGFPHDLVPHGSGVWFTTTDGVIWRLPRDGSAQEPAMMLDTFAMTGRTGWCRGLDVDDEHVLVGLTRVVRRVVDRWCDRPHAETRTQLLLFERRSWKFLDATMLDGLGTHAKIFGVVQVPGDPWWT